MNRSGLCKPVGIALLMLALPGCTARPRQDPFSGDLSGTARNGPEVRVTLEVVCDACFISYSVGATTGSARQERLNPIWITRWVRHPITSETVHLTATSDTGSLRRVRIFVDGEVAAVDDNDATWSRTTLCATARVPRADSGEPDRSGCTERSRATGEASPAERS